MRRLLAKLVNVEDRTVAVVLWLVALITSVALISVPDAAARDAVLKAAGGTVVLLGSYFAARTLKQTRSDQRATRILKAIEMVGHERPAVRVGALWTLVDLASSSDARRESNQIRAVLAVLDAVPAECDNDLDYAHAVAELRRASCDGQSHSSPAERSS
jgi:hypothetical protein